MNKKQQRLVAVSLPLLAALLLAMGTPARAAAGALDRIKASGTVRVCESGRRTGQGLECPAAVCRQVLPQAHRRPPCRTLRRGQVGVGRLPVRTAALPFTQPYLQSDLYAVTTRSNRVVKTWADIDQPGVHVTVQAGTFMEPVMAAALKQAKMSIVKPPAAGQRRLGTPGVAAAALLRAAVRLPGEAGRRGLGTACVSLCGCHQIKRDGRPDAAAARRTGLAEILVKR